MLKTSVQSKGILDDEFLSLEDGFKAIKMAGLDGIDLNLDVFLKNSDLYEGRANSFFHKSWEELQVHFEPYREACIRHGLSFFQMHAPYPVWLPERKEQNEYVRCEVLPKSFQVAGLLGIPYVVVHPIKLQYQTSQRNERSRNLAYFEGLIPFARENHLVICLENLYESIGGRLVEGVCAQPEEAVWYIDSLNAIAGEDLFGFCLDTGHLNLVKGNPREMIGRLGTRLKILHLHENDGRDDLHQLPYTFGRDGSPGFDWEGVLLGLREIGYQGVLNFETFPSMNSFPEGIRGQVLETIAQIGSYFAGRIENG